MLVDLTAAADVFAKVGAKVGANVNVSADVKAKLAAEFTHIIQAIVKICVSLVAKLGATVALSLCVQIDAMINILLLSIDACVSGVFALCVKLLVDIDVDDLLKLNRDLCTHVLGFAQIKVLGTVGIAI
ncbi:hypothetical protein RSAG8_11551, partial [Rhizoctonia solani AG-8 WAC10335]